MSTIQLINTTPEDLSIALEKLLVPGIVRKIATEFQPKQPSVYMTRSEVCEMLIT